MALGTPIVALDANSPDDVFRVVTARLATVLLQLAVDVFSWSAMDSATDAEDRGARTLQLVERVLARLRQEPPVVPRLPGQP